MKICINCNKEIVKKSAKIYCNNKCQNEYQYTNYINRWKNKLESGVRSGGRITNYLRRYIFIKYNSRCSKCGWNEINTTTNKTPLQVNHIDGNWYNNDEENLELLCPNCHSLTDNYCALNKGKGRPRY